MMTLVKTSTKLPAMSGAAAWAFVIPHSSFVI
ncbi:MAG: hypothetical protein RIS79_1086 [Verrucomicrobiota bacterium]|jgi:hypothetical protein